MVGETPYAKPCTGCGKQIILGIDRETNKWRPWDDFASKIKHNCSARAVSNEKIATMATSGNGAATSEEVALVHARVTELQTKVDMLLFLSEKIAKKAGVELDESNE
jgi:hypothetical protein